MAVRKPTDELFDPRKGGQAIRIESPPLGDKPFELVRTNYFSIYLITSGSGTFWADASQFSFGPGIHSTQRFIVGIDGEPGLARARAEADKFAESER